MPFRTRVLPRALALLALTSALALSLVLVWDDVASAVSTRSFVLDDAASLAAGELHHVAVRSDGRVTPSVELTRIAVPDDVPIVWSWARAGDALFLGTGDDGRVYRVRGETVELFAETHQLLVSSLAMGDGGLLFAGTLPEGRIFAIDTNAAPGTAPRELVRPDAAEHVWALAWDAPRHRLFAATGPEGRVYAITGVTGTASADLFWDSVATHVMSLALAPDGSLYAGTSDDAIVVHITSPGHAETVFDFPGNEITSIALANGVLAVAANEFPDPPAVSTPPTKRSATASRAARARPGRGRLYTVGAAGRAERVWASEDGHVTRVQIAQDGTLWAGLGVDGRVIRVLPDRTSSVWIDVDEREVLAMDLLSSSAPFVATGDGGALYRVGSGAPRTATWMSRVLDASFTARWGQLTWRGAGTLRFSTRSGDTERPDETWSEWSSVMTSEGPIRSPAARFLQIRAELADPAAAILAVSAYYLPENQRPVVSDVAIKARTTKRSPDVDADAPEAPSPMLGLAWKIDNTDSDRIRYRLRYREEGQVIWRDMLRESETLTALEYQWSTAAVPDGYYVVSVEASDELSNPDSLTLRSTSESEPLLVDNHPPEVSGLAFAGGRVRGRARDSLGPVARLEAAIDGGEWRVVFPEDDLLDTRDEAFAIDVSSLTPGSHIVAVRAIDAAGNQTSAEITVTVAGGPAARRVY